MYIATFLKFKKMQINEKYRFFKKMHFLTIKNNKGE